MNLILYMIVAPLVMGLICFLFRRKPAAAGALALAALSAVFIFSICLFSRDTFSCSWGNIPLFAADGLGRLICLGIGFFGVVVGVYSIGYFGRWERSNIYYGFLLLTESAAMAAALADNLVLLLVAWGFMGIPLYVLINMGGGDAAAAAKKTMIVVGGSDAFMVLGAAIACLYAKDNLHPFLSAVSGTSIPFSGGAAVAAYLCFAAAAFAKAGAMPFHSWIPDCAEHAPIPVTAFLPASLDKLLGIYLLARVSLNLFVMDGRMQLILMIVGAATIVCAVMMAMVQHNMKRLLGYHAVSQVGYMVLGIGTGNPLGIAGGLFHMVNHCLYKSCLFLSAGAVEKRAGTSELDDLGGLAKVMPVSFVCCLVASLAISGIPPLNGFASKWMVYQGLIEMGKGGGCLWIVWLLAAMFGSVLTLASFIKLLNATFLGRRSEFISRIWNGITEVNPGMWAPMAVIAGLCIVFGVLAMPLPVRLFIAPAVMKPLEFIGVWSPALATWLILIGIALGLLVYRLSITSPPRECEPFIGGEDGGAGMSLSGVDFYQTIKEMGLFRAVYTGAEEKAFDIYDRGKEAVLYISGILQRLHGGVLPVYLSWCVAGLLILLFLLMR